MKTIVNPKLLLHCQFRDSISYALKTTVSSLIISCFGKKSNQAAGQKAENSKLVLQKNRNTEKPEVSFAINYISKIIPTTQ